MLTRGLAYCEPFLYRFSCILFHINVWGLASLLIVDLSGSLAIIEMVEKR